MKKGISIHIGLNSIDPAHYNGNDGKLKNPENDARAMCQIADSLGFESTVIMTKDATSSRILSELFRTAQLLSSGDTFLITFAGHGAQVDDLNKEENDGFDETWVLYDRMLLDDELYNAWSKFQEGVRIIVLSDSCHSGTVTRKLVLESYNEGELFRFLPPHDALTAFENHKDLYESIKYGISRDVEEEIKASVLLLSGCQDNQLSSDGVKNGLFTTKLLSTWSSGNFEGNYKTFHAQIRSQMPSIQTPNYLWVGASNDQFESEKPFTIEGIRGMWNDLTNTIPQNGKKISWEIEVVEDIIKNMSEEELKASILTHGCDLMLRSFKKFKDLPSQILSTRGGEISGGCSVGDKGWSCDIKGTIRF